MESKPSGGEIRTLYGGRYLSRDEGMDGEKAWLFDVPPGAGDD